MIVQEAYIRGVSGWNFDVAALKRSANEEGGPGLERLSTIPETAGLTPACCCDSADTQHICFSPAHHVLSPVLPIQSLISAACVLQS